MSVYQTPHRPESDLPTQDHAMRHVFVIVGEETLFLCHMINLYTEGHNWELVLRITLEEEARKTILQDRDGTEAHFLANPRKRTFSHPDLIRRSLARPGPYVFQADVWKGRGTLPRPADPDHNWLPWDDARRLLRDVPVTVDAVVHHRHVNLNQTGQKFEQYFLFGAGAEAHIYHSPTREPDYDHIATLVRSPAWLKPEQVESGVMVSVPSLHWHADKTYCKEPIPIDKRVDVLFHGITQYQDRNWEDGSPGPIVNVPSYDITMKRSWWFETGVINLQPPTGSQCI